MSILELKSIALLVLLLALAFTVAVVWVLWKGYIHVMRAVYTSGPAWLITPDFFWFLVIVIGLDQITGLVGWRTPFLQLSTN